MKKQIKDRIKAEQGFIDALKEFLPSCIINWDDGTQQEVWELMDRLAEKWGIGK